MGDLGRDGGRAQAGVRVAVRRQGPTPHFQLVNGGNPISTGGNDSTRPDITFSGNTPVRDVARGDVGTGTKAFVGHFVNAANPMFVLDESDVPLTPTAQADVREPISSGAPQRRSTTTGRRARAERSGRRSSCSPTARARAGLFADAYQPDAPITGAAGGVDHSPRRSRTVESGGCRGQRVLPVRHDDCLRSEHRGPDARPGQCRDAVHRAAHRPTRRDHDPLPGGRPSATSGRSSAPIRRWPRARRRRRVPARRRSDMRRSPARPPRCASPAPGRRGLSAACH